MSNPPDRKAFRRPPPPPKPSALELGIEELKKRFDKIEADLEEIKTRWEKRK